MTEYLAKEGDIHFADIIFFRSSLTGMSRVAWWMAAIPARLTPIGVSSQQHVIPGAQGPLFQPLTSFL